MPCWTLLSVEVLVEAVQVVPGALLHSSVSRSASIGSAGSTRGLVAQYCQ